MDDSVDTDEHLMLRLAAGCDAALQILMRRHMRRSIRLAESIVRSAAEADDIAQEAFVRVWRNAASFDADRARFSTWLNRIVVNLAIDRTRRPEGEPIDNHMDIPASEASALARLLANEKMRAMETALARLPARQRVAIVLFHFEDLSGRDCAEAMGLTSKAFESLLCRARCMLKKSLGEEDYLGNRT